MKSSNRRFELSIFCFFLNSYFDRSILIFQEMKRLIEMSPSNLDPGRDLNRAPFGPEPGVLTLSLKSKLCGILHVTICEHVS